MRGDYDIAIIGAGPAGISASIYAARKKLNFILISEVIGGQVLMSGEIENFLGYSEIDGVQLVERMVKHMEHFNIKPLVDTVVEIKEKQKGFLLKTKGNEEIFAKRIILCTGSEHRKLNVPGEKEYTGRGVSYCYTCDAPFFKNVPVVVVGGGNSAFEAAEQLLNYASKIYIVEITNIVRADEVLRDKVISSPKVKLLLRHAVREIKGDGKKVKEVIVEDLENKRIYEIPAEGVFVEIGLVPRSELAKQVGAYLNERNEIVIDCNNRTTKEGIYAAGDCTNVFAKQIITAA